MKIKVLKVHPDAVIPEYKTAGSAGFDLAAISGVHIEPRGSTVVGTGLAFQLPQQFEMQIRSRSGLAFKHGVTAFHGTVDSDFRAEVKVLLFNNTDKPVYLAKGERIAQGVINKVENVKFVEVNELDKTERGSGGFGSTGRF